LKDKRIYSMTARERKAQRRAAEKSAQKNDAGQPQTLQSAEQAMAASQTRSRRSAVVIGVIVGAAVLAILLALLIPVIALLVNPYSKYDSVIARFKLSNGMVLEYEIDEEKYDTAATNFIFLAKNGYFDNTVFFDAQSGWLRFGGYDAQPVSTTISSTSSYDSTHHRSDNKAYCAAFKALPTSRFKDENVSYKFGYKLRVDNHSDKQELLKAGVLTYLYSDTSTEFQFLYDKDNMTNLVRRRDGSGNLSAETFEVTMVGYALNDKTINNLSAIAATAADNDRITNGYLWKPPTPNIYIDSVKVYNLSRSKWRNFDFIDYMNGTDSSGRTRLSGWTGKL